MGKGIGCNDLSSPCHGCDEGGGNQNMKERRMKWKSRLIQILREIIMVRLRTVKNIRITGPSEWKGTDDK